MHDSQGHQSLLILGAGPYGIALAHALWERGEEFLVVGQPFATWQRHTLSSMRLRSEVGASNIESGDGRYDFARFLTRHGQRPGHRDRVSVQDYRGYLKQTAESLPFPIIRQLVSELRRDASGFHARLDDGTRLRADRVVLATGLGNHRYLPACLQHLPEELCLHSWEVERIEAMSGKRVLVLGRGQSAAETVAHLRRNNRVTWAMRRQPFFCREPLRAPTPVFRALLAISHQLVRLPAPLLRALSRQLFQTTVTPDHRALLQDPRIRLLLTDAEGLQAESAAPAGGSVHTAYGIFDCIIAATGFRPRLGNLSFLAPELASQLTRHPAVGRDFQTHIPGLYAVGALAEQAYGPIMRFLLGARLTARRLAPLLSTSPSTVRRGHIGDAHRALREPL